MSLGDRGFFSFDALFAMLLIITVSTLLLNSSLESQQIARNTSQLVRKDLTVEKLATAINTVYSNGGNSDYENFEIQLNLPVTIMEENYTIICDSDNRVIYVKDTDNRTARAYIVSSNVHNFSLDNDNLDNTIHIYWDEENIQVTSWRPKNE